MVTSLSLCTNCTHSPGCVLANGHAVMECEEHEVAEVNLISEKEAFVPARKNPLKHFRGLCQDCELAPDCVWNSEDSIIFNCEHYQ